MSRLSRFVAGAGTVAQIQEHILDAMGQLFTDEEYPAIEATILAPGLDGWESRAIRVIKEHTKESFDNLGAQVQRFQARFRAGVPYPGQSPEIPAFMLDKTGPHLRVYWCTRCGHQQTNFALSAICCHGSPKCLRCSFELHEPSCVKMKQPEKETT